MCRISTISKISIERSIFSKDLIKSICQTKNLDWLKDWFKLLNIRTTDTVDLTQSWSDDQDVISANLINEGKSVSKEDFPAIEDLNTEYARNKCLRLRNIQWHSSNTVSFYLHRIRCNLILDKSISTDTTLWSRKLIRNRKIWVTRLQLIL